MSQYIGIAVFLLRYRGAVLDLRIPSIEARAKTFQHQLDSTLTGASQRRIGGTCEKCLVNVTEGELAVILAVRYATKYHIYIFIYRNGTN